MYLKNINKFLNIDFSYNKKEFLQLIEYSNINNFNIYKLEKDFLLTVILIFLWKNYPELIFKWWTCLNKIYLDYFRLSEDLDFNVITDKCRSARRVLLKNYKEKLIKDLSAIWLKILDWRTKHNNDTQWIFHFSYKSLIDNSEQVIQIDISLKEKIEKNPPKKVIKSVFRDLFTNEYIFWENIISVMDFNEIVSEKLRAALTRTTPAIRDFFDIYYIKENTDFNFDNIEDLLFIKLKEADFKYTIDWNFNLLKNQISDNLLPMLDKKTDFDFEEVYEFILKFKI